MAAIGFISKDQKNAAQGFKFRGIDQFINALYPEMVKEEVFCAPKVTSYTQELKDVIRSSGKPGVDKHVSILVEYTFTATDGSSVTLGPIAAEGVDSGDKATNKALSAGLKYTLIQSFFVPTEDMAEADFESPVLGSSVKKEQAVTTVLTQDVEQHASTEKKEAASQAVDVPTPPVSTEKRRKAFTTPPKTQSATNGSTNGSAGNGGW